MKRLIALYLFTWLWLVFAPRLQAQFPVIYNAGVDVCPPGAWSWSVPAGTNIAGTAYDSIYQTECASANPYTFTLRDPRLVPGAIHTLYLHFAEIYHGEGNANPGGGNGSRVFSVWLQDELVLDSLDIHKEVGPSRALVYRYDVAVAADNSISIQVVSHVGEAKISMLEVHTAGEAVLFPPTDPIIDLNVASLPVEWGNFEVRAGAEGRVVLDWSTLSESNNDRFEVMLAREGQAYAQIGEVAGRGTTQELNTYRFETEELQPGRYSFRIRQIDFDGTARYSAVREWVVDAGTGLYISTVYPNPASDRVEIRFIGDRDGEASITLYTLGGAPALPTHRIQLSRGSEVATSLDVDGLAAGMYILTISHNGKVQHRRLAVQ
ncbi:MAG: hypothetical protein OHK0039_12340 [Bacteroidia bacterium]